ncbi:uncharacterized protein J3D65DRAFT_620672 [Phyllosticta citribraziliensis]|uniref:Uncharacterized protein n=1 Tax=Phyllosticta citribraziliensis TaxID=989973 RepID=A0ABR1LY37_9PEZI
MTIKKSKAARLAWGIAGSCGAARLARLAPWMDARYRYISSGHSCARPRRRPRGCASLPFKNSSSMCPNHHRRHVLGLPLPPPHPKVERPNFRSTTPANFTRDGKMARWREYGNGGIGEMAGIQNELASGDAQEDAGAIDGIGCGGFSSQILR